MIGLEKSRHFGQRYHRSRCETTWTNDFVKCPLGKRDVFIDTGDDNVQSRMRLISVATGCIASGHLVVNVQHVSIPVPVKS